MEESISAWLFSFSVSLGIVAFAAFLLQRTRGLPPVERIRRMAVLGFRPVRITLTSELAAGVAGFVAGGFIGGTLYVAALMGWAKWYYWANPPNGNDFQYLGMALIGNFALILAPGAVVMGGFLGGIYACCRYERAAGAKVNEDSGSQDKIKF